MSPSLLIKGEGDIQRSAWNMEKITELKKYFRLAIKSNLLKFEVEKSKGTNTNGDIWLTVLFHNSLTSEGKDWKWNILCAQSVKEYRTTNSLINRITLMLAESLRSKNQDVNILMNE